MMFLVLFLGVLFLPFFYLVGSFFLQHRVCRTNGFTQHVLNFWIGLLLTVSVYALVKTGFVTVLFLLPLVLVAFKKDLSGFAEERTLPSIWFVLGAIGLYLLLFFLQVHFSFDVLYQPTAYLPYLNPYGDGGERYVYSTILSFLHYQGVETISTESVLRGFTGVSLYHFAELWLGSLFKTVYNVKSDIALFYFVGPLLKTFLVLSLCAVFADQVNSKSRFVLVAGIVFCFVAMGVLWITPPLHKAHLRDALIIPVVILVARALYLKKYDAALALLLLGTVENILLFPAVFITLTVFFNRYSKSSYAKTAAFLGLYLLFFYLFKEKVENKYFDTEVVLPTVKSIYGVLIMAVLTYPFRLVISYFFLRQLSNFKARRFEIEIACWVMVMFFAYQTAYALVESLSIDAWQLKYIAEVVAKVAFVFLLYELLRRHQALMCLVVLLLLSDYKHPFEKIDIKHGYDKALERKIEAMAQNMPLKGFFVDEKMPLPEEPYLFYYPTHATDYARSNDFRMYLFHYDVTGLRTSIPAFAPSTQRILSNAIQPLFNTSVPVLENLRQHDVSIVWVHKNSKYLDSFAHITPLHELDEYFIYHLPKTAK